MPPSERDWSRDRARFAADADQTSHPGQGSSRDHGAPLGPLAQQFATLTYSLLEAETVAEVLWQVVQAARHVVSGADVVSVTLRAADGAFHTPLETDPVATRLDALQAKLKEGPCLTASDEPDTTVAVSDDLAREPRWPQFGPAAAEQGMGAVTATRLLPAAQSSQLSGALNIYSRHPGGLSETDRSVALLLAVHASLALVHTEAVTRTQLRSSRLHEAIDSREVLGRSKRVLMGSHNMGAEAAFDRLRHISHDLNVKLVTLAETFTGQPIQLEVPGHGENDG